MIHVHGCPATSIAAAASSDRFSKVTDVLFVTLTDGARLSLIVVNTRAEAQ
jgi:hypothetical protein